VQGKPLGGAEQVRGASDQAQPKIIINITIATHQSQHKTKV
jgi:hypothetical protein